MRTVGSSNVKSPKIMFVVPASARLISSGTMNTVFGCGSFVMSTDSTLPPRNSSLAIVRSTSAS